MAPAGAAGRGSRRRRLDGDRRGRERDEWFGKRRSSRWQLQFESTETPCAHGQILLERPPLRERLPAVPQ
eukprot:8705572-Heterocapsa_arctica.AAC.1